MKSLIGRLVQHSAIYGGALLLSKSLVLFLLPIYSRKLTPSEYGTYSLLLTSSTVLSGVLSLGFGTALVRHAVMSRDTDPRDYYVSTLGWYALLALVLVPLTYLLSPWLAGWLLGDRARSGWVFLTALAAMFTVLALAPGSYLRYRERAIAYSALRVGQLVVAGALNVCVLLALGWGIGGLLATEAVVAVGVFLIGLALCRDGLRGRASGRAWRELAVYGIPLVPATLAMTALQAADRYFLNALGYDRELGLYSMAYRFGFILYLIVSAMQTAWPPVMYAAAREDDAPRRFASIYTGIIAVFFGIGVALVLASPPAVALLTTRVYWDGSRVLPLVVPAYVLHGIHALVGFAIYQSGRTPLITLSILIAVAVNLLLNALLIPGYGMMGAALATLIAYGVLVVMTGMMAHRLFPVHYQWTKLIRIAAIALGLSASGIALRGELGTLRPWLVAAAGTVLYPAALVASRVVTRSELRSAGRVLDRLRRKGRQGGDRGPVVAD